MGTWNHPSPALRKEGLTAARAARAVGGKTSAEKRNEAGGGGDGGERGETFAELAKGERRGAADPGAPTGRRPG